VRRAQRDGFANSRPQTKAQKQQQAAAAGPAAAKQLLAIGAGDGELGNKVEALDRAGR
jgi:hypothetical protein